MGTRNLPATTVGMDLPPPPIDVTYQDGTTESVPGRWIGDNPKTRYRSADLKGRSPCRFCGGWADDEGAPHGGRVQVSLGGKYTGTAICPHCVYGALIAWRTTNMGISVRWASREIGGDGPRPDPMRTEERDERADPNDPRVIAAKQKIAEIIAGKWDGPREPARFEQEQEDELPADLPF